MNLNVENVSAYNNYVAPDNFVVIIFTAYVGNAVTTYVRLRVNQTIETKYQVVRRSVYLAAELHFSIIFEAEI